MAREYIDMLETSLIKKNKILEDILRLSNEQTEIIKNDELDWDVFNENVEAKGLLVDEISKLDEGFDIMYNNVKDELNINKSQYADSITRMKALIKSISEKSADIESVERRNKAQIESIFNKTRQTIKQSKVGTKAAMQYYQKMSRVNTIDPQLMDKKS